jgi:2,4-dienoyl-CoA reductase-like NADH-dependent reductase (Old Yellow Enzyme family)
MALSADFRKALAPWALGPLRLRNRIVKSATNEGSAPGGVPSQALVRHHRAMAAGGVGMTTVAYCAIEPDGRTFPDQVCLDAATVPHLRVLTDAVHREGAAASAQLTHGGAFTFLPRLSTPRPFSASGGFNAAGVLSGRPLKAAMTRADMDRITAGFVAAARRAREAGFDAVELHLGHGYLLSQFLSPAWNRRRDDYGGSAAARVRYPAEVLRAVLDAVGGAMAVACKLSLFEGHARGATTDDVLTTTRALSAEGAHLLVLSAGMNIEAPWAIFGSPMPRSAMQGQGSALMKLAGRLLEMRQPQFIFREMYLLEAARRVRAAVRTPLGYLGGARSVAGIESAMREGFDAVVMGRALIHTPDLVRRFEAGELDRSGCTACNECIATMYTPGGTRCVLTTQEDPVPNSRPAFTEESATWSARDT